MGRRRRDVNRLRARNGAPTFGYPFSNFTVGVVSAYRRRRFFLSSSSSLFRVLDERFDFEPDEEDRLRIELESDERRDFVFEPLRVELCERFESEERRLGAVYVGAEDARRRFVNSSSHDRLVREPRYVLSGARFAPYVP